MKTSTSWSEIEVPPLPTSNSEEILQVYTASPLPRPYAEETDVFDRQEKVPGHNQSALDCRILLSGGGGLNSWIGVGLVRCGVTSLTIIDPDFLDRTNLPRQLFFPHDLGQPKGTRLAKNLQPHSTNGARLTGIAMRFEDAVDAYTLPCDLLVVGVDNNPARLAGAIFARQRRIPAVYVALSRDGMRINAFLQGPRREDPCWHCAQPNLDPERASPCAAAIISTCFLAASFALFFCHRALMGWPEGVEFFNWREADMLGIAPDLVGVVRRQRGCPTCGKL